MRKSGFRSWCLSGWLLVIPALSYGQMFASYTTSLKADAVVRLHERSYEVVNAGEAIDRKHLVVTIFNEDGQKYARELVYYSKLEKVNDFEGRLYDANGKEIRKLKKADIRDVSAQAEYSLYDENRIKYGEFSYANYPYTVEFRSETVSRNTLFYPNWFPQYDEKLAVEKATFELKTPRSLAVRFRELNGLQPAKKTETGDMLSYFWQVQNLHSREDEPFTDHHYGYGPGVMTAPTQFEIQGHKGSLHSWKELGQFFYDLNKGRDELPAQSQAAVLKLVEGETDPLKKIQKLYEFLQKSTRYVSIQMGIGGWQTFPASTVVEKGYGDCKALSNYMMAMLKVVGIPSYTASIGAGSLELFPDFPSASFNHEILCVPMPKDTLWLECTSQSSGAGYLGKFTGNKYALLETPTGGVLVKTTQYQQQENLQKRQAEVVLDAEGNAVATLQTIYTGIQQEKHQQALESKQGDDLKRWLVETLNLPSFDLASFQMQPTKSRIPEIKETLNLRIRKTGSISGKRLFLTVNQFSPWRFIPSASTDRKHEVVWALGFTDTDTIRYRLQPGYRVEALPDPILIKTEYGTYEASVSVEKEEVIYRRSMQMPTFRKPASAYSGFVDFCKKVSKADRIQVVLAQP